MLPSDVTRDAQERRDGSCRVPQRHGIRFQTAARALEANNVKLQFAGLTLNDLLMQRTKRGLVLRGDELQERTSLHFLKGGCFQHSQSSRIHVQQNAISR